MIISDPDQDSDPTGQVFTDSDVDPDPDTLLTTLSLPL